MEISKFNTSFTNIIYETEQSCIKIFLSEVLKNLLIFKLQLS